LLLVTNDADLPDGALDQPIPWVHSSDLTDPTPFVQPGQVLLTTGTQFGIDNEALVDAYVERLHRHRLGGLGFGTEVIRAGIPEELIRACLKFGLPLFEVPYRIPFIAVAREVARILAEEEYARQTWAVTAQRAITHAALRPDGLNATLAELSRQLEQGVAMYDATGKLDRSFPAQSHVDLHRLGAEVARLLRRGRRASTTVALDASTWTLQTLGDADRLSGVIAVGGGSVLDPASKGLVESVIALAGLALQQNRDLQRARTALRSGLLRALLAGGHDIASEIAAEMWGGLPAPPLQIGTASVDASERDALLDFLELRAAADPGSLFFAIHDDDVVLCLSGHGRDMVMEVSDRFNAAVGMSNDVDWSGLALGLNQSKQAHDRAISSGGGPAHFHSVLRDGLLGFLSGEDIRTTARTMLEPLKRYDTEHHSELGLTLRSWLEHDGRFDRAADALGVHRHTVRHRIEIAAKVLGRDFKSFPVRADIWAALLATAGD
jgi:purine catabolism regulator